MKIKERQKGLLLVEMLIYLAVSILLLGAIGYFILSAYYMYSDTVARAQADRVGVSVVNQIVREIRSGISVDTDDTAFNTPTGFITINTEEGSINFTVDNGVLALAEGTDVSFLNPDTHTISRFYLTQIATPVSTAIRLEVGVTYDTRDGPETRYYNGLSILRESYE